MISQFWWWGWYQWENYRLCEIDPTRSATADRSCLPPSDLLMWMNSLIMIIKFSFFKHCWSIDDINGNLYLSLLFSRESWSNPTKLVDKALRRENNQTQWTKVESIIQILGWQLTKQSPIISVCRWIFDVEKYCFKNLKIDRSLCWGRRSPVTWFLLDWRNSLEL